MQSNPPSPSFSSHSLQRPQTLCTSKHRVSFCKCADSVKPQAHSPLHVRDKSSAFENFVSGVKQCKSLRQVKQLHVEITQSGYGGNVFLGNCLIEMYGECGSLENAQDAFDHIPLPNIFSWNLLLKVYAHNGTLNDARKTFGDMPMHDVISWSTMIAACVRHGEAKEALDAYNKMQLEGIQPNHVTFLSVLEACSIASDAWNGHLIHATIVDSGHDHDVVINTALVSMYGKCGNLSHALKSFHSMQQHDVVAWNAIIMACSENLNSAKALQLYDEMHLFGILPTKITYLCVADACKCNAYLNKAYEIHTTAIEQGFEQDVAVGTALTQMYSKCGSLQSAKSVFFHLLQRTNLSWNTMIAACIENGDGREALKLFSQMQDDGIIPDEVSLASGLDACGVSLSLEVGKQLHSLICKCKLDEDRVIVNALINMYGNCGSLVDARDVFDRLQSKNLISWTAMMTASAQNGHGADALILFEQMKASGVELDMVTFLSALDACVCASALQVGTIIHVTLVDIGYEWDLVVRTALVNMYAKCGNFDDSRRTFNCTPDRDLVCWNTMLAACAQNGYHKETLEYFNHMQLEGTKPDKVTFFYVLTACIHTGKVDEGRQHFYSMVQRHGLKQLEEHVLCMVDLLSRAGHLEEAKALISTISRNKCESGLSSLLNACNIHHDTNIATNAAEQIFNTDSDDASSYVVLSNIYAINERNKGSHVPTVH